MSDLAEIVFRLNKKVDFVLQHAETLKEQIGEKQSQIDLLKAELEQKEAENTQIANKLLLLESAESLSNGSEGGKKEVRLKINELVREIDKCISLLKK